jgi:hypothetical protein
MSISLGLGKSLSRESRSTSVLESYSGLMNAWYKRQTLHTISQHPTTFINYVSEWGDFTGNGHDVKMSLPNYGRMPFLDNTLDPRWDSGRYLSTTLGDEILLNGPFMVGWVGNPTNLGVVIGNTVSVSGDYIRFSAFSFSIPTQLEIRVGGVTQGVALNPLANATDPISVVRTVGNEIKVYQNGVLMGGAPCGSGPVAFNLLGARNVAGTPGNSLRGTIRELRVYNSADYSLAQALNAYLLTV